MVIFLSFFVCFCLVFSRSMVWMEDFLDREALLLRALYWISNGCSSFSTANCPLSTYIINL